MGTHSGKCVDIPADGVPAGEVEVDDAGPERFEELITEAVAVTSGRDLATRAAQTMISVSIGLKQQVSSREVYLQRLGFAIDLLT